MIKLFVAFWISLLSVVVYAELGQSEKSVAFTSVQLELIKSKLLFNKGSVDDSLLNLYVDELCKNAASELQLSDRFLQWLDSEKEIKQGLFSARYPMDVASIERLEARHWSDIGIAINLKDIEKFSHLFPFFEAGHTCRINYIFGS
ncbi:MAG: hypothetical protein ACPGF8_04230, partial [Opitutales bacterium]